MVYQKNIQKNKITIVPKQTLKEIEDFDRDVAGFDMSYDESTKFIGKHGKLKNTKVLILINLK